MKQFQEFVENVLTLLGNSNKDDVETTALQIIQLEMDIAEVWMGCLGTQLKAYCVASLCG